MNVGIYFSIPLVQVALNTGIGKYFKKAWAISESINGPLHLKPKFSHFFLQRNSSLQKRKLKYNLL
jgi:hexokinase